MNQNLLGPHDPKKFGEKQPIWVDVNVDENGKPLQSLDQEDIKLFIQICDTIQSILRSFTKSDF